MLYDKNILKQEIMNQIDITKEMNDSEIKEIIDRVIHNNLKDIFISVVERNKLSKDLFNSIRRLDVLQLLLEDKNITEIMVNGPDNIFIEKKGAIKKWDNQFESKRKLEDVIQQIVSKVNRVVNEASPIVDARLEDGSRINVVLPPIALNGPIVTIRKFSEEPITIEQLIAWESISEEAAEVLHSMVKAKYNIFVSGGTGSGKTTFLNTLSNFIPSDERIITIEDSAELQIQAVDNIVKLETRNPNAEGKNGITIRELIKSSLRMRPDRIIVGEVRGPEALDMLQAMNTGHDGSLSTGHSNSTKDMISRLETMVLSGGEMPLDAIRQQIASSIDVIVHLGRLRDKTRKVLEISEIKGYIDKEIVIKPLFKFVEEEIDDDKVIGKLKRTEVRMHNMQKFQMAGIKSNINNHIEEQIHRNIAELRSSAKFE